MVDDCALSGARFASFIEGATCRILFVHLVSHPKLRRAILNEESRVDAVIASRDLAERPLAAPERDANEAYWRKRLPGKRYWFGTFEPFAFPWNEPDHVLWNAKTNRLEHRWHRASPRRVLAHRRELGLPWVGEPGPIDLATDVVWKFEKDKKEVVLWRETTDTTIGLQGTALDMWMALLGFGDLHRAANHLLERYDVAPSTLRADLQELLDELIGRGVLVRDASP